MAAALPRSGRRLHRAAGAAVLACVVGAWGCAGVPPAGSSLPPAESAIDLGPRTIAQLYEPGEVRGFRFVQAGVTIGRSFGRYLGPDGAGRHVFETKVELYGFGRPAARSQGRLVVDDRGGVIEGFERSAVAELTFRREGDALVLRAGSEVERVGYAPGREAVAAVGRYAVLHQEIVLGTLDLRPGTVEVRLVSLSGAVPVPWRATVRTAAGGRMEVETNLGEAFELSDRRIVRISVPEDDLWVEALRDPVWPAWTVEPQAPLAYAPPADADFVRRPVRIPQADGAPELAGELLVPPGRGPFPGVLFLSGAGRQDRYGFAGPPPHDLRSHEITDALAAAGLAVLRFDDRGTGDSGDGPLGFRDEALDARRALGVLLVQEEVDPDRVVLVGHGEGGWHALHLAREDPKIVAVVLVGTPGRRYDAVVRHQARTTLAGLPPALARRAFEELEAKLRRIVAGERGPVRAAPWAEGPEDTYLREIVAVDPAALFSGGCARVLVVQGGADFEVDPQADPDALVAAARRAGRHVERVDLPGLDHRLVAVAGRSTPATYLERGGRVAEAARTAIVRFVVRATKEPGAFRGGCPAAPGG